MMYHGWVKYILVVLVSFAYDTIGEKTNEEAFWESSLKMLVFG